MFRNNIVRFLLWVSGVLAICWSTSIFIVYFIYTIKKSCVEFDLTSIVFVIVFLIIYIIFFIFFLVVAIRETRIRRNDADNRN